MVSFWPRYATGMVIFALAVVWGWIVHLVTRSPERARQAVARIMGGPLCRWLSLDVQISGVDHLAEVGACVLVANHQGHVDEVILANVYQHLDQPVILAKMAGVWSLPLFKRLFEITGNIVVDSGPSPRHASLLWKAREALASGGQLGIYPEGTRRPHGRLGPFKQGAFILAVEARVPIVPIVVSRLAPEFDPPNRHMEPAAVRVRVLEPIQTEGLTRADVGRLKDEVRDRMKAVLDEDEERDVPGATEPARELP